MGKIDERVYDFVEHNHSITPFSVSQPHPHLGQVQKSQTPPLTVGFVALAPQRGQVEVCPLSVSLAVWN